MQTTNGLPLEPFRSLGRRGAHPKHMLVYIPLILSEPLYLFVTKIVYDIIDADLQSLRKDFLTKTTWRLCMARITNYLL